MKLDFKKLNGLLPVVVQDFKTNEILMLAFMNEEALNKTLKTKKAYFFSRSRNRLWMKGEESGNIQEVKEILVDCDNDSIILKVKQFGGAACHDGYKSCFYRKLIDGNLKIIGKKVFNPEEKYEKSKK